MYDDQEAFNPYAAMSAVDLQGVAQQQFLENINRQKNFIQGRKAEVEKLRAKRVDDSGNVLLPLAALTDSWTGSKLSGAASQFAKFGSKERDANITKIENSISNSEGVLNKSTNDLMNAALREKLAKWQMNMLGRKLDAKGAPDLKEYEHKAAAMGNRAQMADEQYNSALASAQTDGYDPISQDASFDRSGFGKAMNFVGINDIHPAQKAIDSSELAFLLATLRDESGAAIGEKEADNQRSIYFPRFGDTKEVIANKASLRKAAREGLINKAGAAWQGGAPKAQAPQDDMAKRKAELIKTIKSKRGL